MFSSARWWTVPPAREVSYLTGADPELLSISLDPLPPDAPAVVQFHPAARGSSSGDQVEVLLDELDRAAVALFPRWLPGTERLDGPNALGVAAVRALAAQMAARSHNFGPFLAELAERSLRAKAGQPFERRGRLPAEVRAAGLARVVAATYGRECAAVLAHVPIGLSPVEQHALAAAAEWLAHHGRLTVWLVGGSLDDVDRLRSISTILPADLTELAAEAAGAGSEPDRTVETAVPVPALTYPPLSGMPGSNSDAEQALERALARCAWAEGRRWNYTYEHDILRKPYRLDLFWPAEGVVVEVDGPDHHRPLKYADDRRRDVRLQLLGHDVLRFTNEQVLSDIATVVLEIKQLLDRRRADAATRTEMRHQHVQQ